MDGKARRHKLAGFLLFSSQMLEKGFEPLLNGECASVVRVFGKEPLYHLHSLPEFAAALEPARFLEKRNGLSPPGDKRVKMRAFFPGLLHQLHKLKIVSWRGRGREGGKAGALEKFPVFIDISLPVPKNGA